MSCLTGVKHSLFFLLLLFHFETFAQVRCENLLESTSSLATSNAEDGAKILLDKDPQLHTSPLVQKSTARHNRTQQTKLSKPVDKINLWLDRINHIAKKVESNPRALAQVKILMQNQFVIKQEQVPESYYELQTRILRERGHGNITITEGQKRQITEGVINDQKSSLDLWTEYLVSNDTSVYPMWLKYWMFTGMTKLSKYDTKTGLFGSRDRGTVAPFPELNREALAYVADAVLKKNNKEFLEEIKDPEFVKLLEGLNFGKLYGRVLFNLGFGDVGKFKTNEGRWILYPQGSNHLPLVKSLTGRNTGWCTAGESTAKGQLQKGDFHVYYSVDENGQAIIPRVAIRMEGFDIAEVRGVGKDQNLDAQINQSSIVSSKMKEFGNRAKNFEEKDMHMRLLTELEKKQKLGQKFSKEELLFLYEIKDEISGFGYNRDPRIDVLKSRRDQKDDFVVIYDHKYRRDEISLNVKDALSGKAKIHRGNLNIMNLTLPPGTILPTIIDGDFALPALLSAEGITFPKFVNGSFSIPNLTSPEGLSLPRTIGGNINLTSLTSAKNLKFPKLVNGDLSLNSLNTAEGLRLPEIINGDLNLNSLAHRKGLKLSKVIKGGLNLESLTSGKGLTIPDTLTRVLSLAGLQSADGLIFPEVLNATLHLLSLSSAQGLVLPKVINSPLYIYNLKSTQGLVLPEVVTGGLGLDGLPSAKGLKWPRGVQFYSGPSDLGSQ